MKTIVASRRPDDRAPLRRAPPAAGRAPTLTIGLLPTFEGGSGADFTTIDDLTHYPNLPTEEVFTTPDPGRVDGHVSATMPLELYGSHDRRGVRIEFERGRATKIDADPGRRRDTRGRRARRRRLASWARSRSSTRKGGSARSAPSSTRRCSTRTRPATSPSATRTRSPSRTRPSGGRQQSDIHVDFMIGSNEVDVDGITGDGDRVPVLRGGWRGGSSPDRPLRPGLAGGVRSGASALEPVLASRGSRVRSTTSAARACPGSARRP